MNILNIFLNQTSLGEKIKQQKNFYDYHYKFMQMLKSRKRPILTVLFYPEFPHNIYKINNIFFANNINITTDLNKHTDVAIFWQDKTYKTPDNKILKLSANTKIINIICLDISKERVEKTFKKIFGYGSCIDPYTFKGKAVQKANKNAVKDSQIVNCPISEKKHGYIYQKLLSNEIRPSIFEEYRALILDKRISFCHFNLIIGDNQFDDHNQLSFCGDYHDFFSQEEITKINLFCEKFKIDYGELDIIRDSGDEKIYIIDVATTPGRNPSEMSRYDDTEKILKIHAKKILKYFFH